MRIENVRNCYTMLCYDTTRYDVFMIPIALETIPGNFWLDFLIAILLQFKTYTRSNDTY